MNTDNWSETLPGGKLIREGLADFQSGRCTVPACLVGIARTRLSRAGLLAEPVANPFPEPILYGWREVTIDIDLKPDPELAGMFEAIALLKDELDINVELASPDDFIPAIPGWRERSLFIARHGPVDFFHNDPYSQALSKLQRRHDRDLVDVRALVQRKLVLPGRLREMFTLIEPERIRYSSIDPRSFRAAVIDFCDAKA